MNAIITRFAPSPTGNLHIGGIRTALINFIITQQAKKKYSESKFLLRIEDTDKKRSNNEFKENIINGLKWLGIIHDNEIYIQSERLKRHQEVAYNLLNKKKAFKCICTLETLKKKREENQKNKVNHKKLCETCEEDNKIQSLMEGYTIRIKIPQIKATSINDLIQGNLKIQNKEIDNFILLRKDGSPTYMLSVVVDDFDMGVNLIIRGDDHLNNAFRQYYIYHNLNWSIPQYAHIPLIYGEDGKKLSKRHGAVDIGELKCQGYLKDSIINNLILLGWAPPNSNEIITINEIIKLFDIKKISKSSSIFNYDKLNFFNNYFINEDKDFQNLFNYLQDNDILNNYSNNDIHKFKRLFFVYKKNLNFYKDLENICPVYFDENFITNKNKILDETFNKLIKDFSLLLQKIDKWEKEFLERQIEHFINIKKIKFVKLGKPLRFVMINSENGPSITDILFILGKKDSILRIKNYIKHI